jgi:hypothetical protein
LYSNLALVKRTEGRRMAFFVEEAVVEGVELMWILLWMLVWMLWISLILIVKGEEGAEVMVMVMPW